MGDGAAPFGAAKEARGARSAERRPGGRKDGCAATSRHCRGARAGAARHRLCALSALSPCSCCITLAAHPRTFSARPLRPSTSPSACPLYLLQVLLSSEADVAARGAPLSSQLHAALEGAQQRSKQTLRTAPPHLAAASWWRLCTDVEVTPHTPRPTPRSAPRPCPRPIPIPRFHPNTSPRPHP